MLHTSVMIVINIFLDLGLFLTDSWLVDWHFDILVIVCNNDWSQGRILGMHHFVIHRPESVESQTFLIPTDCWLHLQVWLVTDDMVNSLEPDWCQNFIEFFLMVMSNKPWHKDTFVIFSLNKSMSSLSICSDWGNYHSSIFVLKLCWGLDWNSSALNGKVINSFWVLDCKSYVSHTVTMLDQMSVHFIVWILLVDWTKNENWSFSVLDDMTGNSSLSSFESFVGQILKTESAGVEWCSLFCVSHPKGDMV